MHPVGLLITDCIPRDSFTTLFLPPCLPSIRSVHERQPRLPSSIVYYNQPISDYHDSKTFTGERTLRLTRRTPHQDLSTTAPDIIEPSYHPSGLAFRPSSRYPTSASPSSFTSHLELHAALGCLTDLIGQLLHNKGLRHTPVHPLPSTRH